jgi:uncharacterized protein
MPIDKEENMALRSLMLLAVFLGGTFGTATAQAIDCANAPSNNSDKAICASASLRALDTTMSHRYQQATEIAGVRQSQLEWIGTRERCNGNIVCLQNAYRQRNVFLLAMVPPDASTTTRPIRHSFLRAQPPFTAAAPTLQTASTSSVADATDFLNRAAGPAVAAANTSDLNPWWILGGVVVAALFLWQMLNDVCGKCPSCHQWFARMEVDLDSETHEGAWPPARSGQRRERRSMSIRTAANAKHMRARVIHHRHYNQCKICQHEWITTSQETP